MNAETCAQGVFIVLIVFVAAAAVGIPQFVVAVIQAIRGKE